MQKLTLIAITCFLLLSQISGVLASEENVFEEIERVEIGDNCKTTYFKNGTKLIEIAPQINMIFGLNAEAVTWTVQIPKEHPFFTLESIKLIIEIVSVTVSIVATVLGLFKITLYKRSKKELEYIRTREKKSYSTTKRTNWDFRRNIKVGYIYAKKVLSGFH